MNVSKNLKSGQCGMFDSLFALGKLKGTIKAIYVWKKLLVLLQPP